AATPAVPADILDLARDAKEQFEHSSYREAEKTYLKAQAKAPNNVYILSNLGVTQFRQKKYKLAEESFKKAIANAPEDDFSHCTLGIVYYQKNEFDNAIQSLTRALAINPKNATAHNYLGITASQKGWQEAAQKHPGAGGVFRADLRGRAFQSRGHLRQPVTSEQGRCPAPLQAGYRIGGS